MFLTDFVATLLCKIVRPSTSSLNHSSYMCAAANWPAGLCGRLNGVTVPPRLPPLKQPLIFLSLKFILEYEGEKNIQDSQPPLAAWVRVCFM